MNKWFSALALAALIVLVSVTIFMIDDVEERGMKVVSAEKMAGLEDLFYDKEPWLGADGVYSLDISEFKPNTVLWLFGDTLWGRIEGGRKVWTSIPNNSIALQDTMNGTIRFYSEGKNVFKLAEWIQGKELWGPWPFAPFIQDGRIYLFLEVIDLAGFEDGDWLAGIYLAEVENPEDSLDNWRINYYPADFLPVRYENHSYLWLATDVLSEDGIYYMYGVRQEQIRDGDGKQRIIRHFVVARTKERVTNQSWEFYDGARWVSEPQVVKNGPADLSTEYSVDYIPCFGKYLLVYQNDQTEDRSSILARWADTPVGPWSEPQLLYNPPEADDNRWAYAMKAHYPHLSEKDNEVVISYVVRSYVEEETLSDPALYRPRFVRIAFSER